MTAVCNNDNPAAHFAGRPNSKVKLGPDAREMDARSARMYVLDDEGRINVEHVIFFLS